MITASLVAVCSSATDTHSSPVKHEHCHADAPKPGILAGQSGGGSFRAVVQESGQRNPCSVFMHR